MGSWIHSSHPYSRRLDGTPVSIRLHLPDDPRMLEHRPDPLRGRTRAVGRSGPDRGHANAAGGRHSAVPRRPASPPAQPGVRSCSACSCANSGWPALAGHSATVALVRAASHHGGIRHLVLLLPHHGVAGAYARMAALAARFARRPSAAGLDLRAADAYLASCTPDTHLLLPLQLDLVRMARRAGPLVPILASLADCPQT